MMHKIDVTQRIILKPYIIFCKKLHHFLVKTIYFIVLLFPYYYYFLHLYKFVKHDFKILKLDPNRVEHYVFYNYLIMYLYLYHDNHKFAFHDYQMNEYKHIYFIKNLFLFFFFSTIIFLIRI